MGQRFYFLAPEFFVGWAKPTMTVKIFASTKTGVPEGIFDRGNEGN